MINVHKFGGSCIRDISGLVRIGELISNESKPLVITISALFGVTDYLKKQIESDVHKLDVVEVIDHLRSTHLDLINDKEKIEENIGSELRKLERLLYGIVYTEEVTPRTYDVILSFGERLMSRLLETSLSLQNLIVMRINAEEVIITNEVHTSSSILLESTKEKCDKIIEDLDDNIDVIIIPGYYGVTENNVITLLGDSGTDYTATALGYGFESEEIIIWKDVMGFMSADPNVIKEAKTIDFLSYEEAAELSHLGAKILHPRTVLPAKLHNIPIKIKHFNESSAITTIQNITSKRDNHIIKSISYSINLAILRIFTPMGGSSDGIFYEISSALLDVGTTIKSIATSQTCISVLIDMSQIRESLSVLETLKPNIVDKLEHDNNIALIGLVGAGLGETPGIASRVFNAVAKKNVNVEMISSGASKAAYHFTVKETDIKAALKSIHEEFF